MQCNAECECECTEGRARGKSEYQNNAHKMWRERESIMTYTYMESIADIYGVHNDNG
jgi:hypothetical protein